MVLVFIFGFVFNKQFNINPITLIKIGTVTVLSLYILGGYFATKNYLIVKKNDIEIKEKNILNLILIIYISLIIASFIYIVI